MEQTKAQLDAAYWNLVATKVRKESVYCKNDDCKYWYMAPECRPYLVTYDDECPDCVVRKYLFF